MTEIIRADSTDDIDHARELFREYEAWLEVDLCFQNFEKELAELPGGYAPPDGRLLLAVADEKVAGCVALRKIGDATCEIKRLFVRQEFRGQGSNDLDAGARIAIFPDTFDHDCSGLMSGQNSIRVHRCD